MKKTVLLFPGQGSQKVGMGSLFETHPIFKQRFEEANDILGFDLKKMVLEGPDNDLKLTQNGQPAILTISTICHQILKEQVTINLDCVLGHSLGEYSALIAAGVISFKDAVLAVHKRGLFMQDAVPVGVGGMAAILNKDQKELETLCKEVSSGGKTVVPANYNSPQQVVIAGYKESVEKVLSYCKGTMLPVSAPFHCSMMQPAAEKMKEVFRNIEMKDAKIPIINNANNQLNTNSQIIKNLLIDQITYPVRWYEAMNKVVDMNCDLLLEMGDSRVLGGLMKRINKSIKVLTVNSQDSIDEVANILKN